MHLLARCTLAGDLKLVERIHSALGMLEAKAIHRQTFEEGRPVSCDLKDRPTFPVGAQIAAPTASARTWSAGCGR